LNPQKKTRLFGTDGIRAKAGAFPLDLATVRIIGASLAEHLTERRNGRTARIVIGRDTRESGPGIAAALTEGARSRGAEVESAGVITTPGVAFLARSLPADAGVVISASHNPYYDNGIKIFDPSGRKLDDTTERKIESDIFEERFKTESQDPVDEFIDDSCGPDLREKYLEYLEHEVARDLSLQNLKIVLDCANGAASELAPRVFEDLGATVMAINDQPDGRNINLNAGSLHIESLQNRVREEGADLAVAFDGDADRALFVDANGAFVDGDATMWVLANFMQSLGELERQLVVATVMTNLGLEVALRECGIKLVRTDVGDKYVLDELLRSGAVLGGEQSGHIIFPKVSLAGDGMSTALNLLRAMQAKGKSLAELTRGFNRFPQILINVKVREKIPFESLPRVQLKVREIEESMGDRGRLLLRYSGTESLARVMVEGEETAKVDEVANDLAALIKDEIGSQESHGHGE